MPLRSRPARGLRLALVTALLWPLAGGAETVTTALRVHADMPQRCNIGLDPVDFGVLQRARGQTVSRTARLRLQCRMYGYQSRVTVDDGLNYNPAEPGFRRMASPEGAYARYRLYRPGEPAGGQVWDSGVANAFLGPANPYPSPDEGVARSFDLVIVSEGVYTPDGLERAALSDSIVMTVDLAVAYD